MWQCGSKRFISWKFHSPCVQLYFTKLCQIIQSLRVFETRLDKWMEEKFFIRNLETPELWVGWSQWGSQGSSLCACSMLALFFSRCEFWSLSVMSYKLGQYSVWSGMRMKRIGVFQCTSLFRKLQSELSMKTSATFSSKTSTAVIAIRTSYKTSWGSTIQSLWKQTSFSLVGNENWTVCFSIELTQKTYFRNAGQDGLGIPLLPIFCDYDVVLSSVSLVSRHPFSYFLFVCLFK